MRTLADLRNMDRDDLLGMLGLETQRAPIEQWAGAFAAGLLVGVGVALLLAPRTGRQLRADLKSQIQRLPALRPSDTPVAST
jgi:hypothetical protein